MVLLRASVVVVVAAPSFTAPAVTVPALFCSSVLFSPADALVPLRGLVLWFGLAALVVPVFSELLAFPDVTEPALFCSRFVPLPIVPVLVVLAAWLPRLLLC